MSEEEILKILNSYTTDLYHSYKEDVVLKAIRNLLDLYNKEKEKNKKIEETVKKGMKNLWIDSCAEDSGKYSAYMSIRSILEE